MKTSPTPLVLAPLKDVTSHQVNKRTDSPQDSAKKLISQLYMDDYMCNQEAMKKASGASYFYHVMLDQRS